MAGLILHSDVIKQSVESNYTLSELDRLETYLFERGVLSFQPLATGLYPAAQVDAATIKSGYHNVWVRDNVFVAHAHYVNGRVDAAVGVARGLFAFFSKDLFRFDDIIAGRVDRNAPMNRVPIRFDGASLSELPEKWSHAQNDALGYFVWLFCQLAAAGAIPLTDDGLALMEKFLAYFGAIRFWEDEDSGHWEEKRKISASSIGVVVGGLEAMKAMLEASAAHDDFGPARIGRTVSLLADFIGRGRRTLDEILPAECVQAERGKRRRYDAALLFLVHPIGVVGQAMADRIVGDVVRHLQGDVGNSPLYRGFVLVRRLPRAVFAGRAKRRLHSEHGAPREAGLREFIAEILSENVPMLNGFERSGLAMNTRREGPVIHVTLRYS